MRIPIAKPYLTDEEADSASKTILSGWVTQGLKVQEFEENFAQYVGSKYAVAVSNCTTALQLSLIVSGIKSGDEVICPSMSFIATANSIVHAGGIPVFADIDEKTFNIDINQAERLISKKTRAILIVHQIGLPADIDAFQKLCSKYGLKLIEDAACAAGSIYKGKKIGSHSDLVCFSFHPRKVITTGDGGMIASSDELYYNRMKKLRQHGMSVNDRIRHEADRLIFEEYPEIGFNFRMTDIQASVGIKQLEKLDLIINGRRKIAQKYFNALQSFDFIQLPVEPDGYSTNWQSFMFTLKENCPIARDDVMSRLLSMGISTRRGIMTAHREKAYSYMDIKSLPISEKISDNSIILPLYYPMNDKEINYVIESIFEIFKQL
jgi:dTDP-4-amino-4,6-dideoxygalactose transaminase